VIANKQSRRWQIRRRRLKRRRLVKAYGATKLIVRRPARHRPTRLLRMLAGACAVITASPAFNAHIQSMSTLADNPTKLYDYAT
jgi:hypothetical protein